MLTVVTGWSPSGWDLYGRIFLRSFLKYWPNDVELVVYTEQNHPEMNGHPLVQQRSLWSIPLARETLAMYDNPQARGRVPGPGWKDREVQAGYSFRFDAWKFCRQGLIPLDAAARCERGDFLLWLDGDVQTHRPVTERFITDLLPDGRDVAYLGREPKHSEIGFQLYRMTAAVPMLVDFQNLYTSGAILQQREWHSAYAFDLARKSSGIRGHDMTPGGSGHVWKSSVLEQVMHHHKGDRKIDAQRAFYAGEPR